jgi:hypothetical protein
MAVKMPTVISQYLVVRGGIICYPYAAMPGSLTHSDRYGKKGTPSDYLAGLRSIA